MLVGVFCLEYAILSESFKKAFELALTNSLFFILVWILISTIVQVENIFLIFFPSFILAGCVWLIMRNYINSIFWWILDMGLSLPLSAVFSSLIANRLVVGHEYRIFTKTFSAWMIYILLTGISMIAIYANKNNAKQRYTTHGNDYDKQRGYSQKRLSPKNPDEVKQIYEDYLKEAQAISRPSSCTAPLGWIGISLVALLLDVAVGGGELGIPYITIIALIGYLVVIYSWDSEAKKKIKEINEKKPGFEDFYSAYRLQQAKDEQKLIAVIAAAAVSTTTEARREQKKEQLYRDIKEIKNKLDKL